MNSVKDAWVKFVKEHTPEETADEIMAAQNEIRRLLALQRGKQGAGGPEDISWEKVQKEADELMGETFVAAPALGVEPKEKKK